VAAFAGENQPGAGAERNGRRARLLPDADAIVQSIAPELRSGDVVAILSNGGFGGIYEKLPVRLRELGAPAKPMAQGGQF